VSSQITLFDVASKSGVSFSTAALAFRNPNRVAAKTRERIFAAAKDLGYQRNPAAAALASGSEESLGHGRGTPLVFLSWEIDPAARNSSDLFERTRDWAGRLGYEIRRLELSVVKEPQRSLDILYAQGATGLILGATFRWVELDLSRFAVVRCSGFNESSGYHSITHDVFGETVAAFQKARELGYKAVGCILRQHEPTIKDDLIRHGAVLAALSELGPGERHVPPLLGGFYDLPELGSWLKRYDPDAVIGFSDGDLWILKEQNCEIPEKLGFAALHCLDHGRNCAGIRYEFDSLARHAVQQLDHLLRFRELGKPDRARDTVLSFAWQDGASLPRKI